jgi:dTDP-4-dehydrorhamnose reductase
MTGRVLLTGASGQLGQSFCQFWDSAEQDQAWQLVALGRDEFDLTDEQGMLTALETCQPDILLNAAAYTAVDGAETDSATAFQVNATAVDTMARWCQQHAAHMIHVSTDFVFDGKATRPYQPEHATAPLGVYGTSKREGEKRLLEALPAATIVRTSWLYSEYGHNFVKTMLRLMREKDSLGIVDDQRGSPTSTHSLARLLHTLVTEECPAGIYHWNDGADISWYAFAQAIQRQGLACGLLDKAIPLHPLTTADYPTPATRPAYSVMDRSKALDLKGVEASNWEVELRRVIDALAMN